jgi:RHS repeat-associated protein
MSSRIALLRVSAAAVFLAALPGTARSALHTSETCVGTGVYYTPASCGEGQICAVIEIYNCTTSVIWTPDEAPIDDYSGFEDGPGGIDDIPAEEVAVVVPANAPSEKTCKSTAPEVSTEKGNPIQIGSGQKVEREVDFKTDGQFPLTLERTYRSFNTADGLFGRYWESNFDYTLVSNAANQIVLTIPGRGAFLFSPDPTVQGKWSSVSSGVTATITKAADGSYTATWPSDGVLRFNSQSRILSVKNEQGLGYDFTYAAGKLVRVTAAGGRSIQFAWTGELLTQVTDPAGTLYKFSYLADRFGPGTRLLQKVDYAGVGEDDRTYLYENAALPGALTGKNIGTRRYSWFTYDAAGRATGTEHRNNAAKIERFVFAYDSSTPNTMVVSETNPLGKQASYRFVGGNLESVTGLPSASCPESLYTRTKDANGFPNLVTDFNDNVTDLDYDANGLPIKETHGYGSANPQVITYQWDGAKRRLVSRTVQGDSSVTYGYDSAGRIVSETTRNLSANGVANQARTTTTSYTTHPGGLLATVTEDGPLPGSADAVVKSYNTTGDLVSISNGPGRTITFSDFNGLGQPRRVVDALGVVVDVTYDTRGRRKSLTRTAGGQSARWAWEYDSRGLVSREDRPDGTTHFEYDNANRMTARRSQESVVDYVPAAGESVTQSLVTQFTSDAMSNTTSVESFRRRIVNTQTGTTGGFAGHPTYTTTIAISDRSSLQRRYDELGRLAAELGNAGQNVRYSYDESGYLTGMTDSLGHARAFDRDSQNRITSVTDAAGKVTRYAYAPGGRLASVTDARGMVTRYHHDGFGQLWRLESPDSGVTNYQYDAYGRLTQESKGSTAVNVTRDSWGRPTTLQSGTSTRTYVHDNCQNGIGRICSLTDASGVVAYRYTAAGLLESQSNTINGSTYTTTFAYDANDHLVGLTFPDGKTVAYTVADGRTRTIRATQGGVTSTLLDSIRYHPSGAISSFVYGNGLQKTNEFDADARLVRAKVVNPTTGGVVQGSEFAFDADNRIVRINNLRSASLSSDFAYDANHRLTSASRSGGSESYVYDSVGNRSSQTVLGVATNFAYSTTSNRLLSSSRPGLVRVWTYGDGGETSGFTGVDGAAVGFHYDDFRRIDSSSRNQLTTLHAVNGFGQRVAKAGPVGTSYFIYLPDGTLLAEYSSAGGWTDYIRVGGELVALMRGATTHFVHSDYLGRPEVATRSDKAVAWSANNKSFDRTVELDAIGGLNLGAPGQYFDQETGTWYNYMRDYDASIGRYVQSDPVGLYGGLNTYAYAHNNPVSETDPAGLGPIVGTVCLAVDIAWNVYDHLSAAKLPEGTAALAAKMKAVNDKIAKCEDDQELMDLLEEQMKIEQQMLAVAKKHAQDNVGISLSQGVQALAMTAACTALFFAPTP